MELLIPLVSVFLVVVVIAAKVGLMTTRSFFALAKAMEERGHSLNSLQSADLLRLWQKNPMSIISPSDSDELRSLKTEHASAFTLRVRPWKIAMKVATIGTAIAAALLYYYRNRPHA